MREVRAGKGRLAIGLMSGTSMDGVDAALVRIGGTADRPKMRLLAFLTLPYPKWVRDGLLRVAGGDPTFAEEISGLNFMLGEAFAEAALRVCQRARVSPEHLSVIGSHGQTIHHFARGTPLPSRKLLRELEKLRPKVEALERKLRKHGVSGKEFAVGINLDQLPTFRAAMFKGKPIKDIWFWGASSTFQIAEASVVAERTGVPVVSDFRTADMAAGGQGAPLVPMVDYLLLGEKREGVVALNVGGIANITIIPASAEPRRVFGFDTGPGNMVMDGLVRHFTKGRTSYDAGGRWAARGKVIEPLLERMLGFPFFKREPPKSAGREQFGQWFMESFLLSQRRARPEDLLRTATELTARGVSEALERFVFPKVDVQRLIVSGGGAHNRLLLRRLQELAPQLRISLSNDYGLPVDAKEAMAFALLADRTMRGLPGNLPAVTGARRAVVLGKISRPACPGRP
jgi:anhydro-N-acetylmuramic acid kinase